MLTDIRLKTDVGQGHLRRCGDGLKEHRVVECGRVVDQRPDTFAIPLENGHGSPRSRGWDVDQAAAVIDVAAALREPICELERRIAESLREPPANARPRRITEVDDQPGHLGLRPTGARQVGRQDDPDQRHRSGIDPVQGSLKIRSGLGESPDAPGQERHRQNGRRCDRDAASLPLRPG